MSLTSHLDDKSSPVRRFLRERFPNTRGLMKYARDELRGVVTIRPDTAERVPTTIGMAIDYRARYYFSATPFESLVAWRGALKAVSYMEHGVDYKDSDGAEPDCPSAGALVAEFALKFNDFLKAHDPAGKCLAPDAESELNRYCYVLGLFEEVFRAGPWPTSILFREKYESVDDLIQAIPAIWVDDISQLSALFYREFASRLGYSAILNPTFDGSGDVGGADGDLILGRCLIDFKATVNPRLDSAWIRQLVGYALLDYSDAYRLEAVAIYLFRQGVSLQWPIDEFLQTLTGEEISLAALRDEFQVETKSLRR